MARMEIIGVDGLDIQLSKLTKPDMGKRIVMAGAQPVADEIRKNLKKNLEKSKYSEGDLLGSLGIAPPDIDYSGNANTKVGFSGYDSKGVPNQIKAMAMESGTSKQDKKPFVRPAINKTREKALEAMQDHYNNEISTSETEV